MELITNLCLAIWELIGGLYTFGNQLLDKGDIGSVIFGSIMVSGSFSAVVIIAFMVLCPAYWILIRPFVMYNKRQREKKERHERQEREALESQELEKEAFAEQQLRVERRRRVENDKDGTNSTQAERDAVAAEDRQAEKFWEQQRMRELMQPMMAAMAAQNADLARNLAQVASQLEAANKPEPKAFSEWLWTNPFVRQRHYNRIGRILDKLDKM